MKSSTVFPRGQIDAVLDAKYVTHQDNALGVRTLTEARFCCVQTVEADQVANSSETLFLVL